MARFQASIIKGAQLSLRNVDTNEALGPFVRPGCGCAECGARETLPIRKLDDVEEVLYEAYYDPAGKLQAGDVFLYGGRTWVANGKHVVPAV